MTQPGRHFTTNTYVRKCSTPFEKTLTHTAVYDFESVHICYQQPPWVIRSQVHQFTLFHRSIKGSIADPCTPYCWLYRWSFRNIIYELNRTRCNSFWVSMSTPCLTYKQNINAAKTLRSSCPCCRGLTLHTIDASTL